jgi:hypothetical protein
MCSLISCFLPGIEMVSIIFGYIYRAGPWHTWVQNIIPSLLHKYKKYKTGSSKFR